MSGRTGKRPLLAAYSMGSRSRIASILEEAGTPVQLADTWQEALGLSAKGKPAAMVLPIEASFANDEMELLTEQDILGDRLVRRKKKRKDADAFLAELQALSVGDLIVHTEHGIGKYLGLEPIPVGKSKHDCVQLEYRGGDTLCPFNMFLAVIKAALVDYPFYFFRGRTFRLMRFVSKHIVSQPIN